jgi:hypothetical protein
MIRIRNPRGRESKIATGTETQVRFVPYTHSLIIELELQSLCALHVNSCTQLRPRNPPPAAAPELGLINEGAVGQQRYTTSLCDPTAYT